MRSINNQQPFTSLKAVVSAYKWRPEFSVEEIPAPGHIAPNSLAMSAIISDGSGEVASGRLVILHDPRGNPAWDGEYRCVSFIEAEVDAEMANDPLLADVGWSWLLDALSRRNVEYCVPSGTVTITNSKRFGEMSDEPGTSDVEIRASWTPVLSRLEDIEDHLEAWSELLSLSAGIPPLVSTPSVVQLRRVKKL